ncbi:hypothetical protein B0H13DRAFT_1963401, partial [Mycena leptocephala]
FEVADTVYLFLEDVRVDADGYIAPCRRYWSLDRNGATPMSEGLKTVYGLDQSEIWDIRSQVKYLNGEHFAALDDLCTRFGGALKSDDPGVPSVRSPLKRSQSATRLEKVDWRTDWMWEDRRRDQERSYRKRRKRKRDLCSASTARKLKALEAVSRWFSRVWCCEKECCFP